MLLEYEAARCSTSYDEPPVDTSQDGERGLNAKLVCWYHNKKGLRKLECKADLKKSGGDGRRNGKQPHLALSRHAVQTFKDEKRVSHKSCKVNRFIQTAPHTLLEVLHQLSLSLEQESSSVRRSNKKLLMMRHSSLTVAKNTKNLKKH